MLYVFRSIPLLLLHHNVAIFPKNEEVMEKLCIQKNISNDNFFDVFYKPKTLATFGIYEKQQQQSNIKWKMANTVKKD